MVAQNKLCNKINVNLIPLKVVIFFVFAGLAILHVLNGVHPIALGLKFSEYRLVCIIVPMVSILGPLIAGPITDNMAAKNINSFGTILRVLTAVFLIIAAIFYALLLIVPTVTRFEARQPQVSFGCDSRGGIVFQEMCSGEKSCFHWDNVRHGSLVLTNCSYTCQNTNRFQNLYTPWVKRTYETKAKPTPKYRPEPASVDSEFYDDNYPVRPSSTTEADYEGPIVDKVRRSIGNESNTIEPPKVIPPHLCLKKQVDGIERIDRCHVYTEDSASLTVQAALRGAIKRENDTTDDWCHYPLEGFECNIPEPQIEYMKEVTNTSYCKAMVVCHVIDPYNSPGSVLAQSQCTTIIGSIEKTMGLYLAFRTLGEIFAAGAIALINTAIIVATRETSTGRGEVCRQLVWGSIGWVLLYPKVDLLGTPLYKYYEYITGAYIVAVVLMALGALIILVAINTPLSPPEWWWHTKTGVLVLPMSSIRRYSPEIIALTIITVILGMFWGSIHSYLPWNYLDFYAITVIALLPVLLFFFNVDKFVEFCGHSNVLIGAFAVYIIRFTALSMSTDVEWLNIVLETLEPFTIGFTWITIILYMRHTMPRKFTATGQAIAVIAHFCLGKGLGAVLGFAFEGDPKDLRTLYVALTISACVIAAAYFILYHAVLAPRCVAKSEPAPMPLEQTQQPSTNGAATNGTNGSYTPLRVYHNERGKKGQFRF